MSVCVCVSFSLLAGRTSKSAEKPLNIFKDPHKNKTLKQLRHIVRMRKGKGRGEEARLGWNVFEISKAVNQFDGQEAWQEEEEDQATLAASTYEFITLSGITSTLSWHRLAHAPLRSSSSVSPPLPP